MKYRTNSILGAFLFFSIIFWTITPRYTLLQTTSKGKIPKQTIGTQTKNNTQTPAIKIEAVNDAGDSIGKGFDKFSRSASLKIGKWVKVEVFAGITWLKLFLCLFLTFLVVMVERFLQWLINSAIRKIPAEKEAVSWQQKTCLEIMRRFEAEDVEFAFPSRTIYRINDDKRQRKRMVIKGQES